MKVVPIGDRVLVQTTTEETTTKGGIIIPDTAKEKTQTGKVIAVGDDKEKIKVSVGDKILYDKYAGTQIKVDNEEHLVLNMGDILATIQ